MSRIDGLRRGSRVLEQILAEMHPGHTFVVDLGQHDLVDGNGDPTAWIDRQQSAAGPQDTNSRLDRYDNTAAPGSTDEHSVEEAA